ncbi:MAG: amidohydrolase family protein [Verrucomicrobiales bacterium]
MNFLFVVGAFGHRPHLRVESRSGNSQIRFRGSTKLLASSATVWIFREDAIRLFAINNAKISFEEKEKGSLEVGKRANFIALEEDILTCDVDKIRSIKVSQTYVGGAMIYPELPQK